MEPPSEPSTPLLGPYLKSPETLAGKHHVHAAFCTAAKI